ncbi:MAG: hypothetical protein ACK4UJ_06400 [Leptonema sp. (in: bacteria)]
MILFEKELEKRANPEKSRNFDTKHWIENLYYLKKIYSRIQSYFNCNPLKIGIIGTNGKGTTAYFLSQLFFSQENSVGLYTSPHLITYRERISVNMQIFSEEALSKEYNLFLEFLNKEVPEYPKFFYNFSYFELLTIFTIFIFYKENLKIHIYEAGLGGRLDATKIVQAQIVILTYIRLDHTKILGGNYHKILHEKLGILSKKTKKLFVLENQFQNRIEKYTKEKQYKIDLYFFNNTKSSNYDYLEYLKSFAIFCYENINLKKSNLELLLYPKGRREIQFIENQYYCFDIAHNPSGVYYFLLSLKEKFKDLNPNNTNIFLGILKDRNYKHFFWLFRMTKLKNIFSKPLILNFPEFVHHNLEENQIYTFSTKKDFKKFNQNKKYIIICGSSRLYEFYLKLIEN